MMRLLFVFAGSFALMLLLPFGAEAMPSSPFQGSEAELSTVPQELRAGGSVMVAGSGCAGGNTVRFDFYDPGLSSSAAAVTDGNGTFAQLIHVPSTAREGRALLRAVCQSPESEELVQEAAILIKRPPWAVTWTNVAFGVATSLVVTGLGLHFLRRPTKLRIVRPPLSKRRRRKR